MDTTIRIVMNCCICYKSIRFIRHLCGEVEPFGYLPVKPLLFHPCTTSDLRMTYKDKSMNITFDSNTDPDVIVMCEHDSNGDIQAYLVKNIHNAQFCITGMHMHSNLQILDYIIAK